MRAVGGLLGRWIVYMRVMGVVINTMADVCRRLFFLFQDAMRALNKCFERKRVYTSEVQTLYLFSSSEKVYFPDNIYSGNVHTGTCRRAPAAGGSDAAADAVHADSDVGSEHCPKTER